MVDDGSWQLMAANDASVMAGDRLKPNSSQVAPSWSLLPQSPSRCVAAVNSPIFASCPPKKKGRLRGITGKIGIQIRLKPPSTAWSWSKLRIFLLSNGQSNKYKQITRRNRYIQITANNLEWKIVETAKIGQMKRGCPSIVAESHPNKHGYRG